MTVELPAERVDPEVEKRLREMTRSVRMNGFRPGKVPLSVLRKRYGEQVRQEVFASLIQSSYYEALEQQAVTPAGPPKIEPEDKGPGQVLAYTATFEVAPEIVLGDFGAAEIKKPVAEVTDADLEEMIRKLRKQRAAWEEVERPAQTEDRLTIDFEGKIDGEAFDGGAAADASLELGSGNMIEGFEAGLAGATRGETRSLDVRFPDDYQAAHLAGKPAVFEVTVKKIEQPVLPEIDAAFIQAFGVEEGGEEAFRSEVRSNMERELKEKIHQKIKDGVMTAILETTPLDVPKSLIEQEAEALREHTRQSMGRQAPGIELPLSLFEDQAQRRVKIGLLIAEIVKANGLKVDAEQVEARIRDAAQSYENPDEVVEFYKTNQEQRGQIENLVLEDQVVDWVMQQVQVADEPVGFEELMDPKRQTEKS